MKRIIKSGLLTITLLVVGVGILASQDGQDPEDVKKLEEASNEALEDVKELNEYAEKLTAFRQANENAYGFPNELKELLEIQEATKSFEDEQLDEIIEYYEDVKEKYNATDASDLNVAFGKAINPFKKSGKMSIPWSANTLEQNLEWFAEFKPELEKALEEAVETAETTANELNKAKQLSDFPEDNYDDSDLSEIKEQMLKALSGSVIKSEDEVIAIAIISDWKEGIYTDTKKAYRKINGTVLFADKDADDISRFTSYVFISNEVNGDWQPLKFKAFCNGCPEGWASSDSGSMAGGGGFLITLLWFALVLVNILGGLIAAKSMLNKYHPLIERITTSLTPYAIQIGLIALASGIMGFVMSVLRLQLFSGLIPQVSAALIGIILAHDYIKANAKGAIQKQIDNQKAAIDQVNRYSQIIGVGALIIGIFYLLFKGSFYFM